MARDNQLPFSATMAKVNPRLHTPVGACIIIGALAAVPYIQFSGPTVIAVGATASIYLSYLLGNLAVMRARTRGWPKTRAPFSLGKWGKVVNVVAILWGVAMLVNFLTPSSANGAFDPNASGSELPADLRQPEGDPDRLVHRGRSARRLQGRVPERHPDHLAGVRRGLHPGPDLLLRGPAEQAVRAGGDPRRRGPGGHRAGGVRIAIPGSGGGRFAAAPGLRTGGSLPP